MDVYQIWFELKPGTDEAKFAKILAMFLDHMESEGLIETWRMMRCKLGLKPDTFPEFLLMIETEDMAQMDRAFKAAVSREGAIDELHFSTNSMVQSLKFGLFRDWPDI